MPDCRVTMRTNSKHALAIGMLNFAKQSEEALLGYLNGLNMRDAVLNYHQIHGLLYAMACSPEPIKPSEWFELIWLSDDPQFDDPLEARAFYKLLVELFSSISREVQQERYCPGGALNVASATALADWCDGFLSGHQYLENLWIVALDDLGDEQLYERVEATLDWAIAFVEGDIVDWIVEDSDDVLLTDRLRFEQLLDDYRSVRLLWSDGSWQWDVEQQFVDMQPAARDDQCPCGSGRLFKNCCLH